jgi:TonB family protein
MPTGIVAVKFGCSESGAPSSVQLYKTSGNRRLDRAAMRAVSKIATLHPLPARLRHEQQYIVRVLFANSGSGAEREIRKMQAEAVKSNAWYNQGATSTAAIELVPVG